MPDEIERELRARIADARERLSVATRELDAAISELDVSPRCDKRMVTERLRLALTELVTARAGLAGILAA